MSQSPDELKVGDEIPRLVKGPITRQHLAEWCAAENDYYRIHYDEHLAKSMGLPGAPIQGTYRYALMGQMLSRWLGSRGTLKSISCSYRGLNLEDETITCRGKVVRNEAGSAGREIELEIWVENAKGERSTSGRATVLLTRS
jgi:acyl dehydratase